MENKKTMSDIIKRSIDSKKDTIEEDDYNEYECECISCNNKIKGKPWITLYIEDDNYRIHACKYLCAKNIKHYVGNNYWKYVVNKEDFNEPRPVLNNHLFNNDITVNFGIEEIREEIKNEEYICQLLENEYTFENNLEDPIYDDY